MVQCNSFTRATRRGTIAPLTALLLIPLIGMMAFSIDVSYMALCQAELQNAADTAALAGAEKLQALYVAYNQPGQTQQTPIYTTATTNIATTGYNTYTSNAWDCPAYTAEQFASYNQAGGTNIQVRDVDVSFWYKNGNAAPVACSTANFPNSVQVIARRDTKKNTPLSLFFGPVFGMNQLEITATAMATIYAGDVTSLQSINGVNAHILPVALDYNLWKYYLATGKTWNYTYDAQGNPSGGTLSTDGNGNPQLYVYPNPGNAPGSFGLLDVGVPSNNTPAFRNWIDDGSTPNDISYLLNNNLLPVYPPGASSGPESWKCGPGMHSTLVSNFQSVIGEPNLIPLFAPVQTPTPQNPNQSYLAASGTGQNATYNIIGFVGVKVSQADGNGGGMNIYVEPTSVVDPTAIINNPFPAGSSGSTPMTTILGTSSNSISTFVSAKLTQ